MKLFLGNAEVVTDLLPSDSIDAVVTDPPAGIGFMGKGWDSDKGGRSAWIEWLEGVMRECLRVLKPGGYALVWALPRTSHWTATALENADFEIRDVVTHHFGTGFPKSLDVGKAIDKAAGVERESTGRITSITGRRVDPLSAIKRDTGMGREDAQVNTETLPATDEARQWEGWGTALKPASEHWILARKPLDGGCTVAANVLQYGTGALNIDATRVTTSRGCARSSHGGSTVCTSCGREVFRESHTSDSDMQVESAPVLGADSVLPSSESGHDQPHQEFQGSRDGCRPSVRSGGAQPLSAVRGARVGALRRRDVHTSPDHQREGEHTRADPSKTWCECTALDVESKGRWPANLVLSHAVACVQVGTKKIKGSNFAGHPDGRKNSVLGKDHRPRAASGYAAKDGTEQVLAWKCTVGCPVEALDEQSGKLHARGNTSPETGAAGGRGIYGNFARRVVAPNSGDAGGASRFFYTAKASTRERSEGLPEGEKNIHPTVKSVALMRWLVRLVCPPGGLVLDPFMGSGTTGIACVQEGMDFVGIEREQEYYDTAVVRVEAARTKEMLK